MNTIFLILYTAFLVQLFVGFYSLWLDHRHEANIAFFLICLCCAWWSFSFAFMFTAPLPERALFWFRLSFAGWLMAAGPSLHFFLVIAGDPWLKKRWVYLLIYLPGFVYLYGALAGHFPMELAYVVPYGYSGGTMISATIWYRSFSIYYLGYVLVGIIKLALWGRKSTLESEKKQAFLLTWTTLGSVVLIYLIGTLLPALSIVSVPRIPPAMALIWVLGMWTAIRRYQLLDLNLNIATDEIIARIEDMLLLVNPAGEISRINPSVETVLGLKESRVQKYPVTELFHETDRPLLTNLLAELRERCRDRFLEELNLQTASGEPIPIRLSAASLESSQGDFAGVILIGKDLRETRLLQEEIIERRRVEEELHASMQRLEELDRLKTDFLSSVSHELRTPLTSILGFATIIKKRFEDVLLPAFGVQEKKVARAAKQLGDNIEIIISEGRRLTNLINEVLDIAKMEAGRVEWKVEPFELPDVLASAVAVVQPLLHQKGLTIRTKISGSLPVLCGDRDRIIQVCINILSNAVKFTDEGGVTVSATMHSPGEVLVGIADTGKGIKPEEQDKVFDKFKQVGDTLTDKPIGTGLGLPICLEIIKQHGGRIWVESVPGSGSTFLFTLPAGGRGKKISPTQEGDLLPGGLGGTALSGLGPLPVFNPGENVNGISAGVANADDAALDPAKKYILVVDDEVNIRKYLRDELQEKGYLVREAGNGEEAWKMIRDSRPELIILDVMMPVMDGFTVLETLKKVPETANTHVIMLTIAEEKVRAERLGISGYFTKPINIEALLAKVDRLLS
ncbi:MAG: ATP-binding protein [Dethiobacteria bacterium]|jgi:PAS domain S-box-containing protein